MTFKVFLFVLLAASVFTSCFGSECPESPTTVPPWSAKVFGDCMREAIRSLRMSKDNCTNDLVSAKVCVLNAGETCSDNQATNVEDTMSTVLGAYALGILFGYLPVFCFANYTTMPDFSSVSDADISVCRDGYVAEVTKCSENLERIFRADPLDTSLCEVLNDASRCEVDTTKEFCPDIPVEDNTWEDVLDQARDANFYCEGGVSAADDILKAWRQTNQVISVLCAASLTLWRYM
ncbi:uncharacterized protein [Ptychodera flava]|uniref:uncharacterized protein n=1 Tax=Ptychodera flava TaxID=63121 RepID=UPI00396A9F21